MPWRREVTKPRESYGDLALMASKMLSIFFRKRLCSCKTKETSIERAVPFKRIQPSTKREASSSPSPHNGYMSKGTSTKLVMEVQLWKWIWSTWPCAQCRGHVGNIRKKVYVAASPETSISLKKVHASFASTSTASIAKSSVKKPHEITVHPVVPYHACDIVTSSNRIRVIASLQAKNQDTWKKDRMWSSSKRRSKSVKESVPFPLLTRSRCSMLKIDMNISSWQHWVGKHLETSNRKCRSRWPVVAWCWWLLGSVTLDLVLRLQSQTGKTSGQAPPPTWTSMNLKGSKGRCGVFGGPKHKKFALMKRCSSLLTPFDLCSKLG